MAPIPSVEVAVEQAKREIVQDARDGVVPANVSSFSALHDYVDANEYGGFCDPPLDQLDGDEMIAYGNALQDAVDRWIKEGGLLARLPEA